MTEETPSRSDEFPAPPGSRHIPTKYPPSKQKKTVTFEASPGDLRIMDSISESLGVGRGEAIRTALRVYAALLNR